MSKRVLLLLLALLFAALPLAAQTGTPTPTPTATITPIPVFPLRPGSVEGNINDALPRLRYGFEANAGDSVSIRMENTSGDLDPLLFLYDPAGELLERNDDLQTGNRDAQIAITLTRSGTYMVEATRFEGVPTSGTFRLMLTVAGGGATPTPVNPLLRPPDFDVLTYRQMSYQEIVTGNINDATPERFFVIGGVQGDLVRVTMTRTNGDLLPRLRVFNEAREELSRESEPRAGESIAYITLPQTGWYLIEAGRREGEGNFDLYAGRIAAAVLEIGQAVTNRFTPTAPSVSYIVNARLGDLLTVTMFTTESNSGVAPEVRLLDLSLNPVAQEAGERFATLRTTIPRSGIYIVQANNLSPAASGGFSLRLGSVPGSARIDAVPARYNEQYQGEINYTAPLQFYRFAGKTGELVTLQLNTTSGDLNPFLILMDSDLNELTSNDDAGATRNARITQFRLPKDGEYLILASRSGLSAGASTGSYDLIITAGEIALTGGGLTATLRWLGGSDLNLFVTDPNGRVVAWSNPNVPSGGTLQIDSNADCETPSDQPVEHIFWATPPVGDYSVWVWNQNGCGSIAPVEFALIISVNGAPILNTTLRVPPGTRYETAVRVSDGLQGFLIDQGNVIVPSPQESVSQGGDTLIRAGEMLTGELDGEVYARFYQFSGTAGQTVDIRVARISGDLDSMVILRRADDSPLPDAVNDDADVSTRDSHLVYTLPADGIYIIAVTRFGVREGTTTGQYQISLATS